MLEDLSVPTRMYACRVRDLCASLDEKDAKILMDAVMNPEWKYSTLQTALFKRGLSLNQKTIKAHREKQCSCWKI